MTEESRNIAAGAWVKSFVRTFLIQSVWNAERMQNLGFAYCVAPLLKDEGEEASKLRLTDHLEFFNTNPYLAAAVVGAVGRMEHDNRKPADIKSFKQGLMGPFGALGDSLFWGSMKPVATLGGIAIAIGGNALWAVIATLVIYNLLHLWVRAWGFYNGVNLGRWMIYRFTRIKFSRALAMLGITATGLLAFFTIWGKASAQLAAITGQNVWAPSAAAAIVLSCSFLIRKGVHAETLFYLGGGIFVTASVLL